MFEETVQINRFQITRNQKQNSQNKLMAHFQNSTFLAQQEQLSLFVKNMPLIRIEEVHSLNKLIELLIKQNEALGSKCQQNIITVKEMFSKHDELMRINRDLQHQIQHSQKAIQYNAVNQKQIQSYEEQLQKIKKELEDRQETVSKLTQMTEQLMQQNKHCLQSLQDLAELIKLVGERNFKKCGEKIKALANNQKNDWEWLDLGGLDKFAKEQKKRSKYAPKIRQTVQLFCNRFLKVAQYVPADTLKHQFNKEVASLLQILDDLLLQKRKSNLASQSRLTLDNNPDNNFFQGLLDKILKEREDHQATRSQIAAELIAVRQELDQCKNYYEDYLIKAKIQYEKETRRKNQQLTEKIQIIEYYEEQKEKNTRQVMDMRNKMAEISEALKEQAAELKNKNEQILTLQAKLQQVKSQSALKENELRTQWQENVKTYQYKLSQKQELLEEVQKLRKALKHQLEAEKSELKSKIDELEAREKNLIANSREQSESQLELNATFEKAKKKYEEQISTLQQEIVEKKRNLQEITRKRQKQLIQLKKARDQFEGAEKEKDLQSAYIKQLEQKNKDLQAKLKSSQNKRNDQKTSKKEMDSIKKTMIEEKKYYRQVEEQLQAQKEDSLRQKQENQKLKSLIKEMKKQLEQVYHQFSELKLIESDRQKLIIQMQRSDRTRQELLRNCQLLKAQITRLQQENKALGLQAKHYKSALERIDSLRI